MKKENFSKQTQADYILQAESFTIQADSSIEGKVRIKGFEIILKNDHSQLPDGSFQIKKGYLSFPQLSKKNFDFNYLGEPPYTTIRVTPKLNSMEIINTIYLVLIIGENSFSTEGQLKIVRTVKPEGEINTKERAINIKVRTQNTKLSTLTPKSIDFEFVQGTLPNIEDITTISYSFLLLFSSDGSYTYNRPRLTITTNLTIFRDLDFSIFFTDNNNEIKEQGHIGSYLIETVEN